MYVDVEKCGNRLLAAFGRDESKLYWVDAESGDAELHSELQFDGEIVWLTADRQARTLICGVRVEQSDVWLIEDFDPDLVVGR